jgi:hypothetical protein
VEEGRGAGRDEERGDEAGRSTRRGGDVGHGPGVYREGSIGRES